MTNVLAKRLVRDFAVAAVAIIVVDWLEFRWWIGRMDGDRRCSSVEMTSEVEKMQPWRSDDHEQSQNVKLCAHCRRLNKVFVEKGLMMMTLRYPLLDPRM